LSACWAQGATALKKDLEYEVESEFRSLEWSLPGERASVVHERR
jgi:hypothetical protein